MNPLKLRNLARQINKREETIQELRARTVENCNSAIAEVMLQGQDLLAAKSSVPHGQWMDWLAAH